MENFTFLGKTLAKKIKIEIGKIQQRIQSNMNTWNELEIMTTKHTSWKKKWICHEIIHECFERRWLEHCVLVHFCHDCFLFWYPLE